jgi:fibronectin type 3 domain-containing protein
MESFPERQQTSHLAHRKFPVGLFSPFRLNAQSATPVHLRHFAPSSFLAFTLAALLDASSLPAQVTLPYTVDFEPSENFSLGNLQGQAGWQVEQGQAFVGTAAAFSGTNAVALTASTPPAAISQSFTRFFGEDVTFVDFYALPVADGNSSLTTRIDVEAAQAGFFRVGEQGEVYAFDGDGQGGGQWLPTDFTVPLAEDGRAREWIRFTFRQDFTAKLWDLYLDGALVMADLHFRDNTVNSFSRFSLRGAASADSYFDYFYASADNPLFADQDKDGIDDAWEVAHGLDPTVNDRNLLSGKRTNIERYLAAAKPGGATRSQADAKLVATSVHRALSDAISSISGLRLRLQADAGVTADGSGFVSTWADQSGQGKNATQSTSARRPVLVTNVINGNPVIRFNAANTQYLNVANFMSGAAEGEVFAVVKAGPSAGSGIWRFGPGANQAYYSLNGLDDDFGTNVQRDTGVPVAGVDSFCIYNIAGKSGSWVQRLNGAVHFMATTNTVGSFNTLPTIGLNYTASYFSGDIAEIIVYDHVLTTADRDAVGTFLQTKYAVPGISAPSTPTSLAATAISSTQANLTWGGTPTADGLIYTIERQAGAGSFAVVAEVENTLGYFDTGLTAGTAYTYRIKSRNYAGATGYSSTASVTMPASGLTDFPLTNMRLWLRADAGITGGAARVLTWYDQSTRANQGTQKTVSKEPVMVTNVLNGRPVVRFDSTQSRNLGLTDFMNGASEGEIFAVLKWTSGGGAGLWRFGPGANVVSYSTSGIADDFGSSVTRSSAVTVAGADNFTLYNVSGKSGSWVQRINGAVHFSATSNTVGTFNSAPLLGLNYTASYFNGDIAEVIAYDHALTAADREAVGVYLQKKYALPGITAPSAPYSLSAATVSSTQVNLAWGDTPAADGLIYTIERQAGAGSFATVSEVTGALGYLDTGLTAGTAYTYRLKARNYAGASSYSNTATVTMPAAGLPEIPSANLRLWLRADAGITEGAGRVVAWYDQSTQANQATQSTTSKQPVLVANVLNGRPVVRFDSTQSRNFNLTNFMNGASEGEIFAVLKWTSGGGSGLWRFGPGANVVSYSTSGIVDDFGSSVTRNEGAPVTGTGVFNIYHVAGKSGSWVTHLNRTTQFTTATNTVGSFNTAPLLGLNYTASYFNGDIAEIIAYDHVMSASDLDGVMTYLETKYGFTGPKYPAPTNLSARAVSSGQVELSWTLSHPADTYTLERKTGAGSYAVLGTTTGTTFTDTAVSPDTTYTYRLHATGATGDFSYGNEMTVTSWPLLLTVPTSGLRLWLTPDSVVPDGSSGVQAWRDVSGNGKDAAQATSGSRPLLVASQFNGRSIVRFNGTNQVLNLAFPLASATAGDFFVVLKAAAASGADRDVFSLAGRLEYPNAAGQIADSFASSTDHSVGSPGVSITQARIYNATSGSGEWTARLDHQSLFTTATNTVAVGSGSPAPLLGANYVSGSPGNWFAGDIAEVIVYDRVLSGTERQQVEQQLAAKYGLSIAFPGDADNNGLPDAWETQYFGGTGVDPHADPDGDGLTNAQEYVGGKSPVDFFNGRGFALTNNGANSYAYDSSGRLITASYGNGSFVQFTQDAASNLTAVAESGGIAAWRTTYSLPADGSGSGADAAIVSGDGLPNLVKYTFGLNPNTAATGDYPSVQLTNISGSNYLTLTYNRPDPTPAGLVYTVQVSGDGGATWTSGSGATVAVSSNVVSGVATVVVRDATATGSPAFGRRIRLSIERRAL